MLTVSDPVSSALDVHCHFILSTPVRQLLLLSLFIDEEIEAGRGYVTRLQVPQLTNAGAKIQALPCASGGPVPSHRPVRTLWTRSALAAWTGGGTSAPFRELRFTLPGLGECGLQTCSGGR